MNSELRISLPSTVQALKTVGHPSAWLFFADESNFNRITITNLTEAQVLELVQELTFALHQIQKEKV